MSAGLLLNPCLFDLMHVTNSRGHDLIRYVVGLKLKLLRVTDIKEGNI